MISIKNSDELRKMRKACEISAETLQLAAETIRAGMSTYELDRILRNFILSKGAKPSFLNYNGFRGNTCISVNSELIHGIPSKKKIIREGDIVSVDAGAYIDGFHGDNAYTFAVGEIPESTRRLLKVTKECLYKGISTARAGNRIGDISAAIQEHCENQGYFIVREYIGHGVGRDLHEDPEIPNFGAKGKGPRLVPGMTLAIEPMINSTTAKIRVLDDRWTVVEANGNLSAHFEHTILVTDNEPFIMTPPPEFEMRIRTEEKS